MKPQFISALLLAIAATGLADLRSVAEEPSRDSAARPPVFVPFDFYPRHREELGLNEEQAREMQRLAEQMHETAQKLEGKRGERAKALQEIMAQTSIDSEQAMEQFQALLKTEDEMKALQFRGGITMRNLLTPEQTAKLQPLAMKEKGSGGGANPAELAEKFQQLKAEIHKRTSGGEVPPEVVARVEQIEQAAKQGHVPEAKAQIEEMLRQLRNAAASGSSAAGQPNTEEQARNLQQKIERTDDPKKREQLEEMLRQLTAGENRPPGSAKPIPAKTEGSLQTAGADLEKRLRERAETAERENSPELRDRLQAALRTLHETLQSGDKEAIVKTMSKLDTALREARGDAKEKP